MGLGLYCLLFFLTMAALFCFSYHYSPPPSTRRFCLFSDRSTLPLWQNLTWFGVVTFLKCVAGVLDTNNYIWAQQQHRGECVFESQNSLRQIQVGMENPEPLHLSQKVQMVLQSKGVQMQRQHTLCSQLASIVSWEFYVPIQPWEEGLPLFWTQALKY